MPAVSADGRTYTFRIRPGYAFSPPSNEPITAETFRSTIERALDPRLGPDADGIQWLGDIVGASDYHAGKASVVSGLSSTDDTLSITLSAPSGTFLQRLTMPAFCPVPIGSARIRSGVNDPPLPRSGPYYVSDHVSGQYLILARNPNYPGPRKLGADALVWLTGIDPADAISRLEAGTVDLVPTVEQLDPEGSIARQWGPGSSAASSGDQRYFSSDGGELGFLALNPRDPLLKDPDVRRAIALVLNRTDMARSFGMIATSGLLPAVMTGRSRSQPFKLEGSADATALDEAKRLMAGRTGSIVMSFWPDCDPCQKMATRMTSDLQAIGIGLTVETDDDPHAAAAKKGSNVSMVIGFVQPRYPDTEATLNDIRSVVPPGWLGPGIDSAIAGLDRQADPDRVAAASGLVDRLERTEIRDHPVRDGLASGLCRIGRRLRGVRAELGGARPRHALPEGLTPAGLRSAQRERDNRAMGDPSELSPSQAARRLGTSTRTVQRWIATGRLPARRVGGAGVSRLARLDAFERAQRPPEPAEPWTPPPDPIAVRRQPRRDRRAGPADLRAARDPHDRSR